MSRLDPRYASTTWEVNVSQLVAPGLRGLADRGLGPTSGLAETLVSLDDLTWEARLRIGARFSDGQPVTPADVVYTFASVRDPELGSPYRKTWDDVLVAVDVVDDRTVRFRLKQSRAPLPTDLEFGIVAKHAMQPLDESVRAAVRLGSRPPALDAIHEVVGAGSYRIGDRGPDFVTLVANPYAALPPHTARLTVRTLRDDNARVLALLGGSVDVIINGVTPQVVESLEADPRLVTTFAPSAMITYLGFNNADPILAKREVRQAIAHALDRPRLVASKFRGRAIVAQSPLDGGNQFFEASVKTWAFDPAAARRLLDQAGFPDPDGDGPAVRFTLSWKTSATRYRVALAQAMARQLADVGIGVDVRPFEYATFIDDIKRGNAQLFSLQRPDMVEPDLLRALFHSEKIPTPENSFGGLNRFRFRDDALDRALDAGVAHRDLAARRSAYSDAQRILATELPMLPLWHEDNVLIHRRTLHVDPPLKTGRLENLITAHKDGAAGMPR